MVSPIWHGPVPIIEPSLAVSRTPQRACRKRLPARLRRIEASAQQDELDLDYSSSDESMVRKHSHGLLLHSCMTLTMHTPAGPLRVGKLWVMFLLLGASDAAV